MSLGIRGIEESWLYQEYFQKGLAEGEAKGLAEGEAKGKAEEIAASLERSRKHLLVVGRRLLSDPGESVQAEIRAIDNLSRLDALLERIFEFSTWEELLTPPRP